MSEQGTASPFLKCKHTKVNFIYIYIFRENKRAQKTQDRTVVSCVGRKERWRWLQSTVLGSTVRDSKQYKITVCMSHFIPLTLSQGLCCKLDFVNKLYNLLLILCF